MGHCDCYFSVPTNSKPVTPNPFKGISSKGPRPAASAVSTNGCCITLSPIWIQSKGKSGKWLRHIALFRMEYLLLGRSRSGARAGVGVDIFRRDPELESESPKIRHLRSPGSHCTCKARTRNLHLEFLTSNACEGMLGMKASPSCYIWIIGRAYRVIESTFKGDH